MDTTPADGPLLLSDFPSFEAWVEALSERAARVNQCQHCWHGPHAWQGPLPAPRTCCWCGGTDGPPHGPYAPGGDR